MKQIKIGEYEILLQNLGEGQGKIIIASPYLNTSYYWGSMGSSLEDFICSIDSYYWLNKLLPLHTPKVINIKKTFAAFRKHLFGEALYGYPWYDYIDFHKELREGISEIQSDSELEHDFIDNILALPNRLTYYEIERGYERESVKKAIQEACSEPWHFVVQGESREQKELLFIHKKLKQILKKRKHPQQLKEA